MADKKDDDPTPLSELVAAVIAADIMSEPGPHHDEDCPLYRPAKKASTGAVSNAYRRGWETIFGAKVPIGET